MRIGIIGDNERTAVWEQHLRPLETVLEVVRAHEITDLDDTNICLLIDDSEEKLTHLSEAVKLGIHTFLITDTPTDENTLRRIHNLTQEAGVCVQYSHWPSLSPVTQWMRGLLPKPDFLQSIRETSLHSITENRKRFEKQWVDEVTWLVKWADSDLHKLTVDEPLGRLANSGIRVHMTFENGTVGNLFHFTGSTKDVHRRLASNRHLLLDHDLHSHTARQLEVDSSGQLKTKRRRFNSSESATLAANLFFKAVRLNRESAFTPYDALQSAKVVTRIREQLAQH